MTIFKKHIAVVLTLILASPVWGAFEINKIAPEATALNDAYSALGNDPWAILYNPAQVVRLSGTQAAVAYSRPYLNFGNFRANIFSGLFTRQAFHTGYGVGAVVVDTNVFYREIIGLFNIAKRIGEEEDLWDLSFGTNLKVLSMRRGDPTKLYDPALVPQTINRFTGDIGLHLRVKTYYAGFSAQNILPANFGVVVKENVPIETRFGVGAVNALELEKVDFKISPLVEIANRNRDTVATGGAKIQLLDFVDFNLGAGTRNVSFGFTVYLNQFSARVQKDFRKKEREETVYKLSVGYQYPINGIDTVGSPLVGLSFLF